MAATTLTMEPGRLRRVQTGARAILALGIGASLAANVLAASPSLIGRVIAAWSPMALLLTVELLSRVPVAGGWLSRLRVLAAAAIAGIAAWVSYWHMAEVALSYGEASVAAHLLPFSVDGLVVVAAVCLVELANRIAEAETRSSTDNRTTSRPARRAAPARPRMNGNGPSTASPAAPDKVVAPTGGAAAPSNGARSGLGDVVRRLAAVHPDWTQAELAERAGCSVRTVRRHLIDTERAEHTYGVSRNEPDNEPRPSEESPAAEVAVR